MKPRKSVAYAHNFERHFQHKGNTIDRLEQVLAYGILSPREAAKRSLPFQRNMEIIFGGVENYDDVIFLFPVFDLAKPPLWPNGISAILDKSLEVLTVEEMTARQNGNWVQLSSLYGGEFYRFGSVPYDYFREIILPSKNEVIAAKELIRKYLPERNVKVSTK